MRVVAYRSKYWLSVVAALCLVGWAPSGLAEKGPFRTLVIGGGPDLKHNQVAIESNVRYLARLLPLSAPMRVLFADGNLQSENVQCQGEDKKIYYRAPQLPRLDGAAKSPQVKSELDSIASDIKSNQPSPVLLYFTGHGSPDRASAYNNNQFDLWDGDDFSVTDLSHSLKKFPKNAAVTIVMVQCFSGAFGNILFENGDPTAALIDQHVCGFFAAVPQRMAAGCTPEINEADYKDFSGYFFSALTGTDRLGHEITGVDYNHDHKIGMNEAFAYALLHDDSIDTPVCTSDTFLRKFITTPDPEIFKTSFQKVRTWASASQLAALDGLSSSLGYLGDDQLTTAYDEFSKIQMQSEDLHDVHLIRFVRLAKSVVLGHTLQQTGDRNLKARFADLIRSESGNPFKD